MKNIRRSVIRKNMFIILSVTTICMAVPAVITMSVTGIVEENVSDELINGRKIIVKYKYASKSIDINKFIIMVLASRLELSEQIEVLKAESIMVRTDIYRIMGNNMSIDSTSLGIGFLTENQMKNSWKEKYEQNYNLIADCVASTSGIVMSYNGNLIDARYTQVSSGTTLSGAEVLGEGYEYLQSVSCPDDMQSSDFISVSTITYKDFVKKFKAKYKDIGINEDSPFKSIQIVSKAPDGYVMKLQVGNVIMTGAGFAQITGINSANMTIEDANGSIKITAKGKGDNLGMSMYTANLMGELGNTYDAILTKFYGGITFISE